MAGDTESLTGQIITVLLVSLTILGGEELGELRILSLGRYNDDILIVLGSRPDERDAANVNLLYYRLMVSPTRNSVLKGVEIHDDEVNLINLESVKLLNILSIVAACQNSAKDARVKSLDTSAKDRRVAGDILDRSHGDTEALDEFLRSSGGVYLDAEISKRLNNLVQSVLVED